MEVIKESWEKPIYDVPNPRVGIMLKLKILKATLKNQNWSIFGDINRNVSLTQENLLRIQNDMSSQGPTSDFDAISRVLDALKVQDIFYMEKDGN